MRGYAAALFWFLSLCGSLSVRAEPAQFVLFNISGPSNSGALEQIRQEFKASGDGPVRVGAGAIFSYLRQPRAQTVAAVKQFLRRAQKTDTPVVVQLDGENWWDGRPDLWNWWGATQPGYSPANRMNVEWTGWSPDEAIKIAWRNWGRQIRVPPPPNLMSAAYRRACHEEMRVLIPLVLDWWRALPPDQKHLLVGIKLGWESSIGANAWYYPDGNARLDQPAANDPISGLDAANPPARGVTQIGYAAVKTAGLRNAGEITEADLAEVVRRHLEDLCRLAAELGVPREKLFTHVAGWKENELLYQSGLNQFSCPGWSFYRHAAEPLADAGVQTALSKTDAPFWAAVEWLYQGPREIGPWQRALTATLSSSRCRYVCIYNWEGVCDSSNILQAVRNVVQSRAGNQGADSAPVPVAGAGGARPPPKPAP